MESEDDFLRTENKRLNIVNAGLLAQLEDATAIIDSIKKGDIDSIFTNNNEVAKVLISVVAEHTYKNYIDNMPEGVVTLDSSGIILYNNASFANIVRLSTKEILGANFRDFIPVDLAEGFDVFFKGHPDNDSKITLSMVNAEGSRSHFIVSFNKLHLHDFQVVNLVITDITFQKNAEEKLIFVNETLLVAIDRRKKSEEIVKSLNKRLHDNIKTLEDASAELATFVYIASHDLQEPLRKIFTYSSLLLTRYYDEINEEGKHYINAIQSSSERMRKLINDILEYANLSRNHLFEKIELDAVLNQALSELDSTVIETRAKININKGFPAVEADASQLKSLFLNVLSNSLKFKKADLPPVIDVYHKIAGGSEIEKMPESRFNEQFCVIYLKDNGIGFDQLYIDKIFAIFQRLNNNVVYKGTGIGLAICKKVVEQHHGFIRAKGNPGEGALFTVILPITQTVLS